MRNDTSDPATELFPVSEVPSRPAMPRSRGGQPISLQTVRRWYQTGTGPGVKLETRLIGGQRYCCDAWLSDFINALNPTTPSPARTSRERKRSHSRAEAMLEADGI